VDSFPWVLSPLSRNLASSKDLIEQKCFDGNRDSAKDVLLQDSVWSSWIHKTLLLGNERSANSGAGLAFL